MSDLEDFRILLRGWQGYIKSSEQPGMPHDDSFLRAVRVCATQLAETIDRVADDDVYAGPWHCTGCGTEYYGDSADHECPVGVRPIAGGAPVGVFGRDWTYE